MRDAGLSIDDGVGSGDWAWDAEFPEAVGEVFEFAVGVKVIPTVEDGWIGIDKGNLGGKDICVYEEIRVW